MRAILQRVTQASVSIDGNTHAAIGRGWLVLLGIAPEDGTDDRDWIIKKILNLRAFHQPDQTQELSVSEIQGEVLVVSQFTLYADCRSGRRPSYSAAAKPELANRIYSDFIETITKTTPLVVKSGVFQAAMQIHLCNDGPLTFIIDSRKDAP